jgi:methyltransferase
MTVWFWLLLAFLGVQRGAELAWSRRTGRLLQARGARLVHADGIGLLVAVHVLFFAACATEAVAAPWPVLGWWTPVGLALFACGEAMRLWSMATLKTRWNVRVWVLPDAPLVRGGPYRFMRHPIYLGVALELAGFPLAFGLWATALGILALNGFGLLRRIRLEEKALGLQRGGREPAKVRTV